MKKTLTIGLTLLAGLSLTACGGNNNNNNKTSSGSGNNTAQTTSNSKITVDLDEYNVKSAKTYNVNYENTDWDEADVKVNKVTVYKLAKPYTLDSINGKYEINGFVKLDMSVKANGDISIFPSQGTAVIGNEQEDAITEAWDGEINSGAEKSGAVYIPVKNLDKVTSINNLRFKFDGSDQNNFDSRHDYDLTFDLNN